MISYSEERTHDRVFGKTHKRDERERERGGEGLCCVHYIMGTVCRIARSRMMRWAGHDATTRNAQKIS
jgi:hypothetical protein